MRLCNEDLPHEFYPILVCKAIAKAITGHGNKDLACTVAYLERVRILSVTGIKSVISFSIHFKHVQLCLRAHEIPIGIFLS